MKQTLNLPRTFIGLKASHFLSAMHVGKSKIYEILKNKDYTFTKSNLSIDLSNLEFITYKPYKFDLEIVYEDRYFLIINKPKGHLIYSDERSDNIVNIVSYYYQKTNQKTSVLYAHRLDEETSGIFVFAKDHVTLAYLNHNFKTFKRIYLALVVGKIKGDGVINRKISRHRHLNKMISLSANGKDSKTYYQVLSSNNAKHLVAFLLESGRKHQIRVHLTTLNAYIYGDKLYGNKNYNVPLMLHSYKFTFYHPYLKKELTVYSDVDQNMRDLLERFKLDYGTRTKINF